MRIGHYSPFAIVAALFALATLLAATVPTAAGPHSSLPEVSALLLGVLDRLAFAEHREH